MAEEEEAHSIKHESNDIWLSSGWSATTGEWCSRLTSHVVSSRFVGTSHKISKTVLNWVTAKSRIPEDQD